MTSTAYTLISSLRKIRPLHSAVWRIRQAYWGAHFQLLVGRPILDCGPLLERVIEGQIPFAVGKIGSVEGSALRVYLQRNNSAGKIRRGVKYSSYISESLYVNAGVFPKNDVSFDFFAEKYIDAVKQCDALVSWKVAGEAQVFRRFCSSSQFVRLDTLEPFFHSNPWTRQLAGKRVLVISPFVSSIQHQFGRREGLWANPNMLPTFQLLTVRAPLSAGLAPPESACWDDALEKMISLMNRETYDVALIGAGAFSLPLAVNAKRHGKIGIHLGGSLQVLFGILGSRWEKKSQFRQLIRSTWIRPSEIETPAASKRVEDGCYW